MVCAARSCASRRTCSSLVDPATAEGMRLHLSHECDAEIRTSTSELKGVMCRLNFKLVGGADVVELELTSESDLFFNYIHRVTRDEYTEIFDKQRLTAQFESYASTLTKMIRSCMKDKSFRAIIFLTHDKGTLHFVQVGFSAQNTHPL